MNPIDVSYNAINYIKEKSKIKVAEWGTPKQLNKKTVFTVFPALERATQMAEDSWTSDPSKTPQPDRTTATWSDILDFKNLEHTKKKRLLLMRLGWVRSGQIRLG